MTTTMTTATAIETCPTWRRVQATRLKSVAPRWVRIDSRRNDYTLSDERLCVVSNGLVGNGKGGIPPSPLPTDESHGRRLALETILRERQFSPMLRSDRVGRRNERVAERLIQLHLESVCAGRKYLTTWQQADRALEGD